MTGKVEKCQKNESEEEDFIAKSIGNFGIWQGTVCLMISALRLTSGWNGAAIMFLTPKTEFVCSKFSRNATFEVEDSTCYDSCLEYTYESNVQNKTLVTEFDLICDRAWLASFTQTVLMFGKFVGVTLFGWISDRYGRRPGVLLAISCNTTFMVATCFAPNYWSFTFLRFLVGLGTGGVIVISVVMVVEISGPKYRSVVGCLMFVTDALSQASLVLFAYYTDSWNHMLLAIAIASSLFMIYFLLLPESPRWLIMSGNTERATDALARAAWWNSHSTEDISKNVKEMFTTINDKGSDSSKSYSYISLLQIGKLRIRCLVAFVIWLVLGICYFGMNQYNSFIGGNIYMTVMISGLIQIPVSWVAILINRRSRKIPNIGSLLVSGLAMSILTFVSKDTWICNALALLGIVSVSTAYTTFYLHTTELFPTPVRNMGLGLTSSGSKIGAMIAPFVASVEPTWMPSVIFATLPFIASVLCIFLPETKGRKLKDNFDEID